MVDFHRLLSILRSLSKSLRTAFYLKSSDCDPTSGIFYTCQLGRRDSHSKLSFIRRPVKWDNPGDVSEIQWAVESLQMHTTNDCMLIFRFLTIYCTASERTKSLGSSLFESWWSHNLSHHLSFWLQTSGTKSHNDNLKDGLSTSWAGGQVCCVFDEPTSFSVLSFIVCCKYVQLYTTSLCVRDCLSVWTE